jgi:hypothetical protein
MTKEEAKAVIALCIDEGRTQGIVKANEFEELLDFLDNQQSSLPSNLDEAFLNYTDSAKYPPADQNQERLAYDAFKAGAEWMAEQFERIEGELVDWYEARGADYCHGISTNTSFEVPEGFYIRKKQNS